MDGRFRDMVLLVSPYGAATVAAVGNAVLPSHLYLLAYVGQGMGQSS